MQVYKIVNKKLLNEAVVLVEVEAPFIAKKVLPGQFIIFRIDEQGERVPLTVADYDREKGTITLIVQMVGRSTKMLGAMEAGEYLQDVVGPLGIPTHLGRTQKCLRNRRWCRLCNRIPTGKSTACYGRSC